MTAASVPTRKASNRAGLWTFLRLLGGWATVAALAYFLWTPNKDWGWPTLLFVWVLATIVADEFAGWFGYMALVLGVLPFLWQTPPERWFIIFPLVAGALFGLLIMKHSGGPFVLPFGAAIFAAAILGAGKIGAKLDPSLTFVDNRTFQQTALTAMLAGVGFSFLRQLVSMIWRWQQARKVRAARAVAAAAVSAPPAETSAAQRPAQVSPQMSPQVSPQPTAAAPASPPNPITSPVTNPVSPAAPVATTAVKSSTVLSPVVSPVFPAPQVAPEQEVISPAAAPEREQSVKETIVAAARNPTVIDLDLTHFEEASTPTKD